MSAPWKLAASAAVAHRTTFAGTALVLAAAGGVLSMVGVLMETGLRAGDAGGRADRPRVVVRRDRARHGPVRRRGDRDAGAAGSSSRARTPATIGATRGQIRGQVGREVLLVGALAVPVGAVLGVVGVRSLRPLLVDAGVLDAGSGLAWSPLAVVAALALVLPVALLAGRMATRETLRIPPVEAVRASAVEPGIGPVRRVAGRARRASPGWPPPGHPCSCQEPSGAPRAAMSAFLLVGAVALAGPALVRWAFGRTSLPSRTGWGAPTGLALQNVRGYSRRLTGVVVPLAIALSVGTIQTSVGAAVTHAAQVQIRSALGSDLVVPTAEAQDGAARAAAVPGVSTAVAIGDVPIQVRTDPDDMPDNLAWEDAAVLTVPADVPTTVLDPAVSAGSLAALAAPGSVAISSDAEVDTGARLGDTLTLRYAGVEHRARVVAVFDRGLGLGEFLATPQTAQAWGAKPASGAVLVRPASAGAELRRAGVPVLTPAEFADVATTPDAAQGHLSSLLVLILLAFVGLGAANALVLTTAGRRGEFRVLHRTGTTRRQLLQMLAAESVLTGVLAWAIGTAAVIPAILGVSVGLLGWAVPVADLSAYLVLSGLVVLTAIGLTLLTGYRTISRSSR